MAFAEEDLFDEVIPPLLNLENTVMVGMSTTKGDGSLFAELMNSAHQYPHLIYRQEITLLCDDCRLKGGRATECHCLDYLRPKWNLPSRTEVSKLMIRSQEKYMEEMQGAMGGRVGCIIPPASVENLKTKARTKVLSFDGQIIYSFLDTNGGGAHSISDTAVVSVVRVWGGEVRYNGSGGMDDENDGEAQDTRYIVSKTIIVGMAAFPTHNVQQLRVFICSYFKRLHQLYPRSVHMHMVESNYGGPVMASVFDECIRSVLPPELNRPVLNSDGFYGVTTTARIKEAAVVSLSHDLGFDFVSFAEKLVCHSDDPADLRDTTNELLRQMLDLRRERRNRNGTWSYTGKKRGRRGQTSKDDLICSLLFVFVHSSLHRQLSHNALDADVASSSSRSRIPWVSGDEKSEVHDVADGSHHLSDPMLANQVSTNTWITSIDSESEDESDSERESDAYQSSRRRNRIVRSREPRSRVSEWSRT